MKRIIAVVVSLYLLLAAVSCSHKAHPSKSSVVESPTAANPGVAKKTVKKPREKVALPPVISVNDSVAHKSVDGRLYYDVMGRRYWKNNRDGKYYIFNKSMYDNPDFKGPQ